jgi:hypothetical protein
MEHNDIATCSKCGRDFDLLDPVESGEWARGCTHDACPACGFVETPEKEAVGLVATHDDNCCASASGCNWPGGECLTHYVPEGEARAMDGNR